MRNTLIRLALSVMLLITLTASALAAEDLTPVFDAAFAELKTPAETAIESGEYLLRTGDSAYVPDVAPMITPFDKCDETVYPAVNGSFESDDPSVVTVDANGLMTGVSEGSASVSYQTANGIKTYAVSVGNELMPELIKNYIYVLNREFLTVKRARLPKYNQYAKWYYGKKKEVGWCSVFTIFCANASGSEPIDEDDINVENPPTVQFLREGQVGNQYDGFMKIDRFGGIPKPGYLVIYADLSKAYRTTHIASVTDVEDRGNGIYAITTVEGNMSNSVKSYQYLYDSNNDNHMVGVEKKLKLRKNMSELPESEQTNPLVQYALHTDHWAVFGFCETW